MDGINFAPVVVGDTLRAGTYTKSRVLRSFHGVFGESSHPGAPVQVQNNVSFHFPSLPVFLNGILHYGLLKQSSFLSQRASRRSVFELVQMLQLWIMRLFRPSAI